MLGNSPKISDLTKRDVSNSIKIKIFEFHYLWRFSRKNLFTQKMYDLTLCLAHFLNKIVN